MTEHVTTVANLPPGYPTLAGVIYGAAATESRYWDWIVWNRIAPAFHTKPWWRKHIGHQGIGVNSELEKEQKLLINTLSHYITKFARRFPRSRRCEPMQDGKAQVLDWTAALHILYSMLKPPLGLDSALPENPNSQLEIPMVDFEKSVSSS